MKDTDLAWAAGFLDGEGSFSIIYDSRNNHIVRITADNTNPAPLMKLQSLFGGNVWMNKSSNERHKAGFKWQLTTRKAGLLAEQLLPYLTVKQEQAKLLMEITASKRGSGRKFLSDELYQYRESLRQQNLVLNKRGPA